ncbi:TerD family protein [Viridibacillus arvi]|uniref:TerD family protein n=1 Tax=Viridibacillus arvi TaxID=263475 RepID=UPI0034CDEB67
MTINLKKGQKIELTKGNPNLKKIRIGLGWDTNKYDGKNDFDLDASVFITDANGKCQDERDFIFYGNLQNPNGSVLHSGDNKTGSGDGDDETINVDLSNIPDSKAKVVVTATIYEADERQQNFGQISNAYIRVIDEDTDVEVLRYDLGEDFSIETALVVGEIYRHNGEWKFSATGAGYQGGLAALCNDYGLETN